MSIEAMKQALEALETLNSWDSYKTHNAATALRRVLAEAEKQEPVQEPAAWAVHYNGPIPLFTKTKAEAEAWGGNYILPLYTAPLKREWIGLTMDEVYDIAANDEIDWPAGGHQTFASLIEAKLKEKNNG